VAIGTLCVMDRKPRALRRKNTRRRVAGGDTFRTSSSLRRIASDLATSRCGSSRRSRWRCSAAGATDIVHDRLEWSDEMLRIFGLVRADFSGRGEVFFERVHPEDRGAHAANLRPSPDNGSCYTDTEYRVVRPDGEIRYGAFAGEAHL